MTSKQENLGPLTFGLDIGIASVGWAVLGENRIVDLGVRCFDKAETAKEGESLNLARRTARLLRRRLRRRAWRLTKLARLLKREGMISDVAILKQQPVKGFKTPNLWQLRIEGLDRKLEAEEWARVIYHLCKHRGFHWVSRAEEKAAESDKGEGGKVKQGLAGTKKLMAEKSYRTAAEMVLAEFPTAQRNKQGDYSKALSRVLLASEFKLLFAQQRQLGNPFATEELEVAILGNGDKKSGLFWAQNPALAGKDLLKMLGHCTFEKTEYRAPKASFTAERHVWLTRLNNLRLIVDGTARGLTESERNIALTLPYKQASDFTYKQLGSALLKEGLLQKEGFKFAGLPYPVQRAEEEKAKDPESAVLAKLPAWQTLRKTLKDAGLENEWQQLSVAALDGKPELLDQIAWVLSIYKEDNEVAAELAKLNLPNTEKMIDALLDIRFDKFSNLSLKALRQIVPHMETGLRYDEACIKAGYHHSQLHKVGTGEHKYLPPFYSGRDKDGRMVFNDDMDIPRNPVVLRALNQARKVVNALIKQYGSPHEVHIEMARDLSKPLTERRDIEKQQKEYRDNNEKHKAEFASTFNIIGAVKGKEFEKYQLYREQQGKCAYSVAPIDIHRLFETGYVEIDHALPYSRSFDDSKNNRVLVLAKENRDKGNRTPFEYLGGKDNNERWRAFVAFVEGNKAYRLAKRNRLLKKDFGEKEAESFRERNINDTRYICRFFKNYVEQYLQLHSESKAKRCIVVNGSLTSLMRIRWGFGPKKRNESDRHHALDAVIAAACGHRSVQHIASFVTTQNWVHRKNEATGYMEWVNTETAEVKNIQEFARLDEVKKLFPPPWGNEKDRRFLHEVQTRLKIDNPAILREEMERLGTYSADALEALRPLFVSRAPQRRNSGAAHKDTIYAQPEQQKAQGKVILHVGLETLTRNHFGFLEDYFIDKKQRESAKQLTRRESADLFLKYADSKSGLWGDGRKHKECQLTDPLRNKEFYEALYTQLTQHDFNGKKAFSQGFLKPVNKIGAVSPAVRKVAVIDKLSGIPIRGGVAKNDTMLRVDVFTKAGKFYLVPVYVYHAVAKALPNRAIVAFKDEEEWTLIDDSFGFCFSLYPNDLINTKLKGESYWGYFSGCDRATGAIGLWAQDRSKLVGKDGFYRVGVKTALSIEKFNVDVLGNIYPAPAEKRRDLA